jgi:hypothetical protein
MTSFSILAHLAAVPRFEWKLPPVCFVSIAPDDESPFAKERNRKQSVVV